MTLRLKWSKGADATGRYKRINEATPRDVVYDSRIQKPRPEAGPVGTEFPSLEVAMNRVFYTLVELFGYPIYTRTVDVAYRTIAY